MAHFALDKSYKKAYGQNSVSSLTLVSFRIVDSITTFKKQNMHLAEVVWVEERQYQD